MNDLTDEDKQRIEQQNPFLHSIYQSAWQRGAEYATIYERGQQAKEWIKSSERMPEFNVSVIVFIPEEDHHITVGMWDVSRKWVLLDEYRVPQSEVTYWMPIMREPLDTSYTKCKYVERSTTEQIRDLQKKNFELEAERSKLRNKVIEEVIDKIMNDAFFRHADELDYEKHRIKEILNSLKTK